MSYVSRMSLVYDRLPAVLYALDLMAQGYTPTDACDKANIRVITLETYVANDPDLAEMRFEAERRGADAMVDALLNPDNHKTYGRTNPQMAKVMSENIKWRLSKLDPKRFGEKIEVQHNITMDRAITQALEASRGRVRELEHMPSLDLPAIAVDSADDEDGAIMDYILS